MNILGISGLDRSLPFKQQHFPSADEREYRMAQGYASAAALVIDGQCVAAAAEERFSRQKHTGAFPIGAIKYCLSAANLDFDDVDEVAHAFNYAPFKSVFTMDPLSAERYYSVYAPEAIRSSITSFFPAFHLERFQPVDHHLAHAASAYYTSGWNEALVVVSDGMGEIHGTSIYVGRNGSLQKLRSIPALDSIGIFYSLLTFHLGFDFNADEYKIMGLAPYGDPARFRLFFNKTVLFSSNGTTQIPILKLNRTKQEQESFLATRQFLERNLIPARDPNDPILDVHRDVAAALQETLDRTMVCLTSYFGAQTRLRSLALAGGVALNCSANSKVLTSGHFDEIYIQPAAGDDGSALGAALYRSKECGSICNRRPQNVFLGPCHGLDCVNAAIEQFSDQIEVQRFDSLDAACHEAARLIADSKVLGWYRGRMEFGPRALGHRSILADPGHPEMRDRINAMVKMREAFRPFAPAVTLEQVHRWFDVPPGTDLPFMIMNVDVREQYRSQLPAITHVNGSARVQTVVAQHNPEFHWLLTAVGKSTGREMVLNTSFNVKGQPIVNAPDEAIATYLRTGIDFLFLENFLISRKRPSA